MQPEEGHTKKRKLRWSLSRQDTLDQQPGNVLTNTARRLSSGSQADVETRLEQMRQRGRNRHTSSHVEDKLCDMFRTGDASGRVNVTKFLETLATTGLRQTDPRLLEMKRSIISIQASCARDARFWCADGLCFDEDVFKGAIMDNIDLVHKALTGDLVVPHFEGFCANIEELYTLCEQETSGHVASYIPQLERVDPSLWGMSLCTVDGQRFSLGDVDLPFTIQSTSKPISYAIACGEKGPEYVHSFVGQEPSGRSFNEIVLDNNLKPHNPMINAGAIMTSSLIKPALPIADRFDFVFQTYRRLTGGEYLGFNNAVFLSERQAADRNFALAYFMRENQCLPHDRDLAEMLDFYFQMCSLETTCESAAVIAATLANGGICPTTCEAVLQPAAVRNTLCLMHSCGMYDYSGQFAFKCGLPAKSGVSGVILLVIPNVMGVALYSPQLDSCGNSVRGVKFCKELVARFNFHHFDNMSVGGEKIDPRKTENEKRADMVHRILFAAAAGDLTAIRRCSLMEMHLDAADYDGRTALHLAAAEGHMRVVNFLLNKCNVPVDPKDRWGSAPIDDSRLGDHEEITELLLKTYRERGISMPASADDDRAWDAKLNNLSDTLRDVKLADKRPLIAKKPKPTT